MNSTECARSSNLELQSKTSSEPYLPLSHALRKRYGTKTYKLPVHLAGTCPNRDGKKGVGGCIFCSEGGGSFEMLSSMLSIQQQIAQNRQIIRNRYGAKCFIAYLMNYTNTYLEFHRFRDVILSCLSEDIVGLSIATRPDCIELAQLEFLSSLPLANCDITFELGAQSTDDDTLEILHRCHSVTAVYRAIRVLKSYGFRVCLHFIHDLPWDDDSIMIRNAKFCNKLSVDEVKLHSLYVVRGTKLGYMYQNGTVQLLKKEDYIRRTIIFLTHLAPTIAIGRIVGRAPERDTIVVNWNTSWWKIRDEIVATMQVKRLSQGKYYGEKGGKQMVKFILGNKGAGKTKWLIDEANKDIKAGNGNIAFVDVDDDHIFSLDYNVRLINAREFGVRTLPEFYGFLSGMLAMDYDLEKIYVDSLYKLLPVSAADVPTLKSELDRIAKQNECEIYINIDVPVAEISVSDKESVLEVQ